MISLKIAFFINIYIILVALNIYLLRELLIADKNRIESFFDIIISFAIVIIPIMGSILIIMELDNTLTIEQRKRKKEKYNKFMNKIFRIK